MNYEPMIEISVMISLKIATVFSVIIGGCILGAVNVGLAQRQPVCKTWSQVRSEIRQLYSQFAPSPPPIPDVPTGFKNGCVFGDNGANTIALYVLRDGLRPRSARSNDRLFDTSIPLIRVVDLGTASVENGRLLQFNNVCASNGTLDFCRNTPTNRAYAKNGAVCFRNFCMRAVGVPNAELLRLWNATRNQWRS